MPSKRTRRARTSHIGLNGEVDYAMQLHAKVGDCYLSGPGFGCACGLRDENGRERKDLIALVLQRAANSPKGTR